MRRPIVAPFRLLAGLALLAVAGQAQAATPDLSALNAAVRPALATPVEMSVRPTGKTFQPITMLQTAVERRLTSDGLTGSLGLLCGRQPSRDIGGTASAFDKDREGKFIGAQLSRAF